MHKYRSGDVVRVNYINKDPKGPPTKTRPGIIIETLPNVYYVIMCVTGTDWTGKHRGIKIEMDSTEGKSMKLTKDSFISVDDYDHYPEFAIHSYMGKCLPSTLSTIKDLMKNK